MKNVVYLFVIMGALFLLSQQPNQAEDIADGHELNLEALEILKESEAKRVKELGQMVSPNIFLPSPPYPAQVTYEAGMTPYRTTYQRMVPVASVHELRAALENAQPGDFIHLADGVYSGNFKVMVSGTADARITLYGSRAAVIEGSAINSDYGLYLAADYWTVAGFTVRNASKGIVTDRANHNILRGLEVYQIGDEGLHFRSFSSDNIVERSWIHDVGLSDPEFGEAIYIGSAMSNWDRYSGGAPDASDRNWVIGNLLGPNVSAESVDIKEGTTGGFVQHNTFISTGTLVVDSWVDVKGNDYEVSHNAGWHSSGSQFPGPVDVIEIISPWGQDNTVHHNKAYSAASLAYEPFRAASSDTGVVSIVLPRRSLPYSLNELIARFPASFEQPAQDTVLLKESIVVGPGAHLKLTNSDVQTLRLLSSKEAFVSIAGYRGEITIDGAADQLLNIQSWDSSLNVPDTWLGDGRAYIHMRGGRMDINFASFSDLGFHEGTVSGVAWTIAPKELNQEVSRGNVTDSHFTRNYFGAYTFGAVEMHWDGNTFANNIIYGFDPHDFSNDFVFENNTAYGNGSHGIIFSRGCERNIIRNNQAFENQGYGIMLDDGKVIPDSPDPRYHLAVPSNYNVIEENRVWDNQDGIVLEGGMGNIVRNNEITGSHRYGIRLKDDVTGTSVTNNTIQGSTQYAIFMYNNSHNNFVTENNVVEGLGGVVIYDSVANIVERNSINDIAGSGIVLKGEVKNSSIANNVLSGRGSSAISAAEAFDIAQDTLLTLNDLSHWKFPPAILQYALYGSLLISAIIYLVPFTIRLIMKSMGRLKFST